MIRARVLLVCAALSLCGAASSLSCRGVSDRIPPPPIDSTPAEVPGAAERAQLGSAHMRPSMPPAEKSDALLTPEGDAVSAAVNAAKARLADAGAADTHVDAGAVVSDAEDDVATLVLSSSVAGELVPCGCSPDQHGGLPRAAGLLAQWRHDSPALVYFDAGDLLFSSAGAPVGPSVAQTISKARTLAQGAALLGAAARVVAERDLSAGAPFVAETAGGIPLLDSGSDLAGARETLLVKAGPSGVPIGLFAGGLGPAPEKSISTRATALRKAGARFVVLLLHPRGDRALADAQAILPAARAAGVDLVVLAHRDDPSLDPNVSMPGAPPLIALEGHGQSLLRIDLHFPHDLAIGAPVWMPKSAAEKESELRTLQQRKQMLQERMSSAEPDLSPQLEAKILELDTRARTIESAVEHAPPGSVVLQAQFVALSREVPEDAAAKALIAAYDKSVAEENLAAATKLPADCPRPKAGEPAFVGVSAKSAGAKSCEACHADEVAFWARTRHARAYETLVAKGKQFSFDCIPCHTTGWQQPGGVCRIDRTAIGGPGVATPADRVGPDADEPLPARIALGRQGVQCEDCHGPASAHAKTGADLEEDTPESSCRRCHDPQNSTHFDFKRYLPWILGPGHGEPLTAGAKPRTRGEIRAHDKLGPNAALRRALEGK